MAKTANLYTRIDPELKEQAEYILNSLGLRDVSSMTQGELNDELEKGYESVLSGDVKPADKVFASLHRA